MSYVIVKKVSVYDFVFIDPNNSSNTLDVTGHSENYKKVFLNDILAELSENRNALSQIVFMLKNAWKLARLGIEKQTRINY